jgi:hypothetical protein
MSVSRVIAIKALQIFHRHPLSTLLKVMQDSTFGEELRGDGASALGSPADRQVGEISSSDLSGYSSYGRDRLTIWQMGHVQGGRSVA